MTSEANRPTSAPTTLTSTPPKRNWSNTIGTILKRYTTLLILIALLCAFSFLSPQFLTSLNLKNLLVVQVTVCCMAFATILPWIVGEFDLSLGYALGFIMMLGAFLGGFGFSGATIIPAMLLAGTGIGAINGLLRISFYISSFIVTLGVGIVLSGVTQGMSSGAVLYSGIPPILTAIRQHELLGFKIPVWFTIGLALVLVFVLEHTPFGPSTVCHWRLRTGDLARRNPSQSVQSAGVHGSRIARERCGPI
jgi:ribose transport system permease protein